MSESATRARNSGYSVVSVSFCTTLWLVTHVRTAASYQADSGLPSGSPAVGPPADESLVTIGPRFVIARPHQAP